MLFGRQKTCAHEEARDKTDKRDNDEIFFELYSCLSFTSQPYNDHKDQKMIVKHQTAADLAEISENSIDSHIENGVLLTRVNKL